MAVNAASGLKSTVQAAWDMLQPVVRGRLASAFINGQWQDYSKGDQRSTPVVSPGTAQAVCDIALGSAADVDRAVQAASQAFQTFGQTKKQHRIELLESIIHQYKECQELLMAAVTLEMGAPSKLARTAQVPAGLLHFATTANVLKGFEFHHEQGQGRIALEGVGVCGLITPWNWPLNQIGCKVAPALAAGCTMVLKPSELTPLSSIIFAHIMDRAGVPAGVFNMVQGDAVVGRAISSHPHIDMISFTGSTRAGIDVAKLAADTVKRVTQELGGKSPNIILESVSDFDKAVAQGVQWCMGNSGQSCNAPTRMLVPAHRLERAEEVAKGAAEQLRVGDPFDEMTDVGPLVSAVQLERVRALIATGIREARLVTGGLDPPRGVNSGFYVRPTVFSDVSNNSDIARHEIFGPVLAIIPYENEEEAVAIANDTPYGLAAYVSGADDDVRQVASRLRAGMVHLNGKFFDTTMPFGGYKQSGNGREWGAHGINDFLEVKSLLGYHA